MNEQVKEVILQYMKRRMYQDDEIQAAVDNRGCNDEEDDDSKLREMSLSGQVVREIACTENGVLCGAFPSEFGTFDRQYTGFKQFVNGNLSAGGDGDLSALLFPTFLHMYCNLLIGGHKGYGGLHHATFLTSLSRLCTTFLENPGRGSKSQDHSVFYDCGGAEKFCRAHHQAFLEGEHGGTARMLTELDSEASLSSSKEVSKFRDHRFSVHLSPVSVSDLLSYLQAGESMSVLQILNQHVSIQVAETHNPLDIHSPERSPVPGAAADGASEWGGGGNDDNDVGVLSWHDAAELEQLRQASAKIRCLPPKFPSVALYTFINTHQGFDVGANPTVLCTCLKIIVVIGVCETQCHNMQKLCTSAICPNCRYICGGFEDSSIQVWQMQPSQFPPSNVDYSHRVRLACDEIYPDGQATVDEMNTHCNESVILKSHNGPVYKTELMSTPGPGLLSCSADRTVRLWDLSRRRTPTIYNGHSGPVWDVSFCSLTCGFASSSSDRTVKLWSLDRVFPLRSFAGHSSDVESVAIHPNGSYIASGSSDTAVRLWSVQDGKPVRLMSAHTAAVQALAFSPDGKLLASAGEDRRINIWDLGSGRLMKDLRGHTDTIYCLTFNGSSTELASGGLDCLIRHWEVQGGSTEERPPL